MRKLRLLLYAGTMVGAIAGAAFAVEGPPSDGSTPTGPIQSPTGVGMVTTTSGFQEVGASSVSYTHLRRQIPCAGRTPDRQSVPARSASGRPAAKSAPHPLIVGQHADLHVVRHDAAGRQDADQMFLHHFRRPDRRLVRGDQR